MSFDNMHLYAFFLCKRCGFDFAEKAADLLTRSGRLVCEGCRVYRGVKTTFDPVELSKLWNARSRDQNLVEIE